MSKIEPGKPRGLFGQKNANNQTTSIFGKPAGQAGAFGQLQQQQQQQQPQHPQPAMRQSQSTFGQPNATPAAATGFGLFGSAPPPAVGGGGGGLFGAPASTGGLFGSASSPSSAFGGGTTSSGAFGGGTTSSGTFGGSGGLFGASASPAEGTHAAPAPPPEDDGFSTFEEITEPGPFSEPTTVVTESPLSVSYAVEGKSTIPSDGVPHQVPVAVLSFDSKVTHVCCPKIEARVYLQVSWTIPSVRAFLHWG
jgi:hypothetical protein